MSCWVRFQLPALGPSPALCCPLRPTASAESYILAPLGAGDLCVLGCVLQAKAGSAAERAWWEATAHISLWQHL